MTAINYNALQGQADNARRKASFEDTHPGHVWIDAEFNRSHHKRIQTACISLSIDDAPPVTFWTHKDLKGQAEAAEYINQLGAKGATFTAFTASAECRALQGIGVDPMAFKWVDLYAEWKQLKMNNHDHMYGRYLISSGMCGSTGKIKYGKHGYSVPPSLVKEDNEGQNNTEVGNSYAQVAYHLLGEAVDTKHKDEMRDLIISDPDEFTEQERRDICAYCESDIKHLPRMWDVISKEICRNFNFTAEQYREIALQRGRYCGPVIAKIEENGIPFDMEAARNLSRNVLDARDSLVRAYVAEVEYPFYGKKKEKSSNFRGTWGRRYKAFEAYIESKPEYSDWPRTAKGYLSQNNDDLKEFRGDPNLEGFRTTRKAFDALGLFNPESKSAKREGFVLDSVDPGDSRLRTLFGVCGTMTGRNAPKARRFPFAMGTWARSLIKPPPGWSVGSIDYGSQEFMVAAALSGDPEMRAAYESGDPYLYFAKAAGAVPPNGTKEDYPAERNLFKATTLGLQFGMGQEKLARKLTVDVGRLVTVKEAGKLIALHKRVYKRYWRWVERVSRTYKRDGYITLKNGWGLNSDCQRMTSVKNFPVQGTAANILWLACQYAVEMDIPVIAPLHDAVYFCCPDDEFDRQARNLGIAMDKAVHEILGDDVTIRQDLERHGHETPWVEKRAETVYNALAPFMQPHESPAQARIRRVHEFFGKNV